MSNSSDDLRNKAIKVMYLIFLSLMFLYIPTDFIDSTYDSNKTFEKTFSDLSKLSDFQSSVYLYVLGKHPEEMQRLYNQYLEIDKAASSIQKHINRVKDDQLSHRGYDHKGYPNDGHWEEATNKIMINQGQADSILSELSQYRSFVGELLDEEAKDSLYTILSLEDNLPSNNNGLSDFTHFYFFHTPLNISILTLTNFQSALEQSKLLAYNNLFKNSVAAVHQQTEDDSVAVEFYELLDWAYAQSDSVDSHSEETSHFRSNELMSLLKLTKDAEYTVVGPRSDLKQPEKSQKDNEKVLGPKPFVKISDPEKAVYFINEQIDFEVFWDKEKAQQASMNIYHNGQLTEQRSLQSSGKINYRFMQVGSYRFEFTTAGQSHSQAVQVIRLNENPVNPSKTEILTHEVGDYFYAYPGMVIQLSKNEEKKYTPKNHDFITTNADFSLRNGESMIRFKQPGYASVKIKEKGENGKTLVHKRFVVQKPEPSTSFGKFQDGDQIPVQFAKELDALRLSQEEYYNQEVLSISSFEIQLAYNSNKQLSKTVLNQGALFESEALHLLSQAQRGNTIIIKNIKAVSSLGAELHLNSIVLSIE